MQEAEPHKQAAVEEDAEEKVISFSSLLNDQPPRPPGLALPQACLDQCPTS